MDFKNKVVLITGASSGIGAQIAVEFSKLNATLALTGRNIDNLNKVKEKCAGPKPLLIAADLNVEKDIENIIKTTIDHYGKLDVLVNNAGILERGSIEDTSVAQLDRIFNTNVRAVYQLTMLAVPHLILSKGNVVNVSSCLGIRGAEGILAYSMSKAALDQFTKCVALELAPKGVRVNSVNPALIKTDIQRRGGMSEEDYQNLLSRGHIRHPLGRIGTTEEVAKSVIFLSSDNASFTTGALLPVDGGRNLACPR